MCLDPGFVLEDIEYLFTPESGNPAVNMGGTAMGSDEAATQSQSSTAHMNMCEIGSKHGKQTNPCMNEQDHTIACLTQTVAHLQLMLASFISATANQDADNSKGLESGPDLYDLAKYYRFSEHEYVLTPAAAEQVPYIDLVSPTLRRQTLKYKDVNQASLLIPYYDMLSTYASNTDNTQLLRRLTISELITAFWQIQVLENFLTECANTLLYCKMKVDWSVMDKDML